VGDVSCGGVGNWWDGAGCESPVAPEFAGGAFGGGVNEGKSGEGSFAALRMTRPKKQATLGAQALEPVVADMAWALSDVRLDDAEFFAYCGDDFGGAFQVGAFVGGCDDGAEAGFAFRDRWEAERSGENSFRK
jgi:hypothetical protein